MELRHLRYFVRVADERHFSRAAASLGISQPPLSQQIRALEDELGVALFDRTSRRVELTEAGRLFLPEARATLAQAAHAIDVARRVQLGELGELSIGFASSVPFVPVVARALASYRRDHPLIHLTLAELPRDEQFARLAAGTIEIGFIRGFDLAGLPPGLDSRLLIEEPLLVAIRDDHPLAQLDRPLKVEDISGLPMVQYNAALGAGFNDQLSAVFERRGSVFRVVQEAGGFTTLLGLVAAGVGISLVANTLGVLHADTMTYRPFDEPEVVTRLWIAHRQTLSRAARSFLALLPGS